MKFLKRELDKLESRIAGLIIGQTGEKDCNRDIILDHRKSGLQRITELHPSYMALQYPLLFPYAEDGYRINILFNNLKNKTPTSRNTISIREYYAFRIQQRANEGFTVIFGGRLFQQFIIDAYTTIEASRIRYVYSNQKTFRSNILQNVKDVVVLGDASAKGLGKRIILPATFTGGPRYMVQNYQYEIAICRAFVSPDLFITITCNPKWAEIQDFLMLIPGQKAENSPDIVSRSFKIKLDNLIDDFRQRNHFGKVKASICTIEFRKRGLPHTHIVLFLDDKDKPKTPEDINKMISAELPDKAKYPVGHQAVIDFMIHGPCGDLNKNCSCMENGKCTKDFPKKLSNDTVVDKYGFYYYMRIRNRTKCKKNGVEIDNRWVVPYNLDLIVKYPCHINVEACNEARIIKYLFKYMQKGNDKSKAQIQMRKKKQNSNKQDDEKEEDEVKIYLDCRFISTSEASWRIFAFNVQFRDPSVERLPFHLENQQQVTFRDDEDTRQVVQKYIAKTSLFLEWMNKNRDDETARRFTYLEFPMHYVWNENERVWTKTKCGTSVGRIYYACNNPKFQQK